MAAEDIGVLYNTKIPGYDDAADIQAALKLYHYGSTTTPTTEAQILPNSVAGHLKALDNRLDTQETVGVGSSYANTQPTTLVDGFIWVDGSSTVSSTVNFATAVYQNDAPTTGLVDGLIWVDKDASPQKAYVYNATSATFIPLNEIENIINAAGDIIYGTADNTIARLGIGTNGQILTVNSGIPSWANQKTWVSKATGSLSGSTVSVSGINSNSFYILLKDWSHNNTAAAASLSLRFNSDSGSNYVNTSGTGTLTALTSPTFVHTAVHNISIKVDLANTTAHLKPVYTIADDTSAQYFGYYKSASAITSAQLSLSAGSFDGGTYEIWSFE